MALKMLTSNLVDLKDILNENQAIEWFNKYSEYNDKIEKIRNDFGSIVNTIIKNSQKKKLVIFIDELDRCNPENAVRLLESIKNYFDVTGCIFVILVDDEVLTSYINKKYKNTKINGQLYLEKIINTKFRVPFITPEKVIKIFNNFKEYNFFGQDPDKLDLGLFPRALNPRKISKIYEKIKLISNPEYEMLNMSEKLSSIEERERRRKIFLMIILNEVYPNIYYDLTNWSRKLLDKIKARVDQFYKEIHRSVDILRDFINYDSEELNFLHYIFNSFKDFDVFYEIDKILKIKKII